MRIDFNISQTERGKFRTACEAVIRNVGSGTRAAVTEAGINIMADSMSQVPVDTGTLLNSAFLGISRRDDVAGYRYGAVLGYGSPDGLAGQTGLRNRKTVNYMDPGGTVEGAGGKVIETIPPSKASVTIDAPMDWYIVPNNGVNPKNMQQASTYAGRVHEDLDMPHPRGGKAKFLEDAVRTWASGRFARTAMTYWKQEITTANMGHLDVSYRRSTKRGHTATWHKMPRVETHVKWVQHGKSTQRGGKAVHKGVSE
jgi:hypothetical protein